MATQLGRKLRMGMIGGGPGAFIGDVHRKAAQFDGGVELVAGAFSRDLAKSKQMASDLYLDPQRCYGDYAEMAHRERERADGVDFVTIVTPNVSHFAIARCFLEAGVPVVCDKPVTFTIQQAMELRELIRRTGQLFAVTYSYTGYPMVKLARDMVQHGMLGEIVKVQVQYPQGWLLIAEESGDRSLSTWRVDPAVSGKAGAMGDIGTHAAHLAEYITGLQITSLCASLSSQNPARPLDDDGNCLLEFNNGATGLLWASQISIGELNALAIKVYGRKGSIEWKQEYPTDLHFYDSDGTIHTYRRGTTGVAKLSKAAEAATRLPFGHPEALYESFANLYKNFASTLRARLEGRQPDTLMLDFPGIEDGIRGMTFIEAVVASANRWVPVGGFTD